MPELNGQVPNVQTPNEQPQVGNPPTETPAEPQVGEPKPALNLEQALRELEKVRREAAEHRVKHKEAQDKLTAFEQSQMSDLEKAQAKVAEYERQLSERARQEQERTVKYEVQLHAAKLGIVDPDAAVKLLDWAQLDFNEDGTPKNAEKLLKALIADKPYLAGTPASGSATNPARNNSQSGYFTDSQISAMSPADYQKNRAAIFAAMKEGRILKQ